MTHEFLDGRVVARVGDLTMEETDAIVNAANKTLLGGGGVDGAIHRAGGEAILRECREIRKSLYPNGLPTGLAVITGAGDLLAKYVIHTVGPIYGRENGNESELLRDSYLNSLSVAADHKLASLSFPSISTGAFAFPKDTAARITSEALQIFFEHPTTIEKVYLVFHTGLDLDTFLKHQNF